MRKIKHFAGYGTVKAEKVKDPSCTLHIKVQGNHEWGLCRDYVDDLFRWLVIRFDKSLTKDDLIDWERNRLINWSYELSTDPTTDEDVCDYIFNYHKKEN